MKFSRRLAKVVCSRRLGGHGEDALWSVSAGIPSSVFVSGRSGFKDFPATGFYRHLAVESDSIPVGLRASAGGIQYATFVGRTRQPNASWYNDETTGLFASPEGDVFVTGCILHDRLPISPGASQPRPKGNSEPFLLGMKLASSQ